MHKILPVLILLGGCASRDAGDLRAAIVDLHERVAVLETVCAAPSRGAPGSQQGFFLVDTEGRPITAASAPGTRSLAADVPPPVLLGVAGAKPEPAKPPDKEQ